MRSIPKFKGGESLKLGIMRDKKKHGIDVEVPIDHCGSLFAPSAVIPAGHR